MAFMFDSSTKLNGKLEEFQTNFDQKYTFYRKQHLSATAGLSGLRPLVKVLAELFL